MNYYREFSMLGAASFFVFAFFVLFAFVPVRSNYGTHLWKKKSTPVLLSAPILTWVASGINVFGGNDLFLPLVIFAASAYLVFLASMLHSFLATR